MRALSLCLLVAVTFLLLDGCGGNDPTPFRLDDCRLSDPDCRLQ